MKKLLFFVMFAVTAAGFTGCFSDDSSDGTKADIRWTNSAGSGSVTEIAWVGTAGATTWNETTPLAEGATNDFKGVKDLTGTSTCLNESGADCDIKVEGDADGGAYTVAENSTDTLVIGTITAKKK